MTLITIGAFGWRVAEEIVRPDAGHAFGVGSKPSAVSTDDLHGHDVARDA